jgi:hypothetical protein
MNRRRHLALPLLFLLFLPGAVKAQGKTTPPTIVLRVNSIDAIVGHSKFLAKLVGQQDAARQIEGLIKSKIGGLDGVDSGRPFGMYGRIGKELDDVSGAVLVPISDEKAFLKMLKSLNLQIVEGGDGIHTIKTGFGIDAYLRFANKYAYVTALDTAALKDKNILDPAKVLAGKPTSAFSLTIQVDQVPDAAKQIASIQAEQFLQEIQEMKVPGESDAQKAFKVAALKEVAKLIAAVFKDGAELKAEVDLDQKSGDLGASFSLSGVPRSELAAGIEAIAQNPSIFTGLLRKDAALNGLGHLKLPEALVKALGDVVDEAKGLALGSIQEAGKKQQAEGLFKAIIPTFKAGDFDGAAVMIPSGKHFTFLGVFKVKGGEELGNTIRDLVSASLKDLPPALKEKIKLDADAVGTIKIHRMTLPVDALTAGALEKVLGELNLYVAFRNDAMFLSLGKDGLQAIKDAIPAKGGAASPMLFYEVDVARLAHLAPPEQAAKAKQLFPDGQGGTVRLVVNGGAALTVRLTTNVAVLQFLGQVRQMKAGSN